MGRLLRRLAGVISQMRRFDELVAGTTQWLLAFHLRGPALKTVAHHLWRIVRAESSSARAPQHRYRRGPACVAQTTRSSDGFHTDLV